MCGVSQYTLWPQVDDSGPEIQLRYVPDASTAGIASLVQRQRGAKKRVPPRRPTSYIPRSGAGGCENCSGNRPRGSKLHDLVSLCDASSLTLVKL